MPEYSSTTITPADGVQVPSMNGSTAGNILLSALKSYMLSGAGQANGLATLGSDGKLTAAQLPDLADDVIVVTTYANLPSPGTASKIYITADTNKGYRWDPDLTTPAYMQLFEMDKSIVFGYYSSGSFYEDSEHTVQITPVEHVFYVDVSLADIYVLNDGTLIELLGTKWAKITDIQDGSIQAGIAVKAFQDAMGRAIIGTYETKADASDLKSAIQANSNRISNLEQEHGGYVTVNYRGTNDVPTGKAKYALVESIVGKSRAWNQLLQLQSTDTINGVTFTNNGDGSYTLSGTAGTGGCTFNLRAFENIANEYYLVAGCPSGGSDSTFHLYVSAGNDDIGSGTITKWTSSATRVIGIRVREGVDATGKIFRPILRKLSVIFPDLPSTDLVTSNIPNLVKRCPDLLKPDAFGQSIVDTTVEGVKSISRNRFDGTTTANTIIKATDGTTDSGSGFQATDYIPVIPNTDFYFNIFSTNMASVRGMAFYDFNKNYISGITAVSNAKYGKRTTPANAYFVRCSLEDAYVSQTCINISDANDGTFTPYFTDTLTLPSSVTLRSAGSVAETYDLETGKKTKPLGSYTFTGSEVWTQLSSWYYTSVLDSVIKRVASNSDKANILCPNLVTVTWDGIMTNGDVGIAVATGGAICVDSATSKDSLTGKTIYFELATPDDPTQLTPVIDNTILTEGGGTINTIQTQTPVIDNSMDVGYLAL